MKLTWKITKKRGNWRPILTYRWEKEDWEHDLAVPGGVTDITVPAVVGFYSQSCLPGEAERGDPTRIAQEYLVLPGNYERTLEKTVLLPWRPGARPEYPEVKEAMEALMREWERRVLETLKSGALEESGEVEHSPEYKKKIAPYVAAQKMVESRTAGEDGGN